MTLLPYGKTTTENQMPSRKDNMNSISIKRRFYVVDRKQTEYAFFGTNKEREEFLSVAWRNYSRSSRSEIARLQKRKRLHPFDTNYTYLLEKEFWNE